MRVRDRVAPTGTGDVRALSKPAKHEVIGDYPDIRPHDVPRHDAPVVPHLESGAMEAAGTLDCLACGGVTSRGVCRSCPGPTPPGG